MKTKINTIIVSLALVIAVAALVVACTKGHSAVLTKDVAPNIPQIEIEGCQYFYETNNGIFFLVHKGNCNNPIHCDNRQQKGK